MIWSLGVPIKQLVTLVSLCRNWPRMFEHVVWPVNETFLWNYGMFVQLKFCGGFINLFLSWELVSKWKRSCFAVPTFETDVSVVLFWDYPKIVVGPFMLMSAGPESHYHVLFSALTWFLPCISCWFFVLPAKWLPAKQLWILLCRFWWVVVNFGVWGLDVFLYCIIPWYLCDLHVLSIWVEAAPRPRSHWVGITLGYDPALTSELCGVE